MKPRTLHIADLFCGAGGTSTGALQAATQRGYQVNLTAINHWPIAIATHEANHPGTRHLCTSIDDVNPRTLFKTHGLDVLWASPECTHHSRARGGKPMHDQSRATAWCVTRWAEALLPGLIFVENVPEFLEWGPLGTNGRPLASKKGATFRAWVAVLESLGYKVDWRILCAADYGAPTTRERLFVQAVRGRRRIKWPERTHAPVAELAKLRQQPDLFTTSAHLQPWVPARDIIDWSIEGRWLDEMPPKAQYGGLPLSPKTLRRIHAGLMRFGLKPFISRYQGNHAHRPDSGTTRNQDVDAPISTLDTQNRFSLVSPFLVPQFGERENQHPRAHDVDEPFPAVTSHGAGALVEPFLVEHRGTAEGQVRTSGKSCAEPLSTIQTSGGHHSLVEPYIVPIDHTGKGRVTVQSIEKPLSTVTTEARHGMVEPYLVATAHGDTGDRSRSIASPLPTICGNRGNEALIEPHLLPQQSCGALRPVSQPMPTVATAGAIACVEPFLTKFYGTGSAVPLDQPLDTITTKDRFALVCPTVVLGSVPYRVRLRWRMLQPHELARGMSFPSDYRFTGTKTDTVKQIGNAVCPEIARALLAAHL
jgi:DNA (cytosine-5)-methyltransferase 1